MSSPEVPEDLKEVKVGSPFCENKTALHFPAEMMESALWIKICLLTNQPVIFLELSHHEIKGKGMVYGVWLFPCVGELMSYQIMSASDMHL